ncbi:hypothetical protein VNO78_33081 [Psophocarpus tetragonolobus]|uniref:Uncharacterized protein n=1 Tax=Psophocarpus tetragonolobus TaxID=3891 RepID=A0AAN9RQG6_PSOTE
MTEEADHMNLFGRSINKGTCNLISINITYFAPFYASTHDIHAICNAYHDNMLVLDIADNIRLVFMSN